MVLDEPTNDVDPVRRRYLWAIRELTDGTAVLLGPHRRGRAGAVDEMAILDHPGQVLALGNASRIKASTVGTHWHVVAGIHHGPAAPSSAGREHRGQERRVDCLVPEGSGG